MNINLNYNESFNPEDDRGKIVCEYQKSVLKDALSRAFVSPFELTSKDFKELQRAMDPTIVSVAKNARRHQHPLPAIFQRIAYDHCNAQSKFFKNSMDVGGTPLRTNTKHHLCTLVDDPRSDARYLNAALLKLDGGRLDKKINQSFYVEGTITKGLPICKHGAENCSFPAEYAYMINVYDIPIETIPLIMHKHNTVVFDAWMFLPNALIDINSKHDETFYKTSVIKRDGTKKIRFSLNDQSTIYEHNYDNWRKYMTTTLINTPAGSIFVEHVDVSYHTFRCVRFTKTTTIALGAEFNTNAMNRTLCDKMLSVFKNKTKMHYERCIRPLNTEGLTIVPDLIKMFQIGEHVGLFHFVIITETRFVEDAYKYWDRQGDTTFNYPNFCAYLHSKSSTVFYQNQGSLQLVYKSINLDPDTYSRLTISLYITGMLKRKERTQLIGSIIRDNDSKGFWGDIKKSIKIFISNAINSARVALTDTDIDEIYAKKLKIDEKRIANAHVKPYNEIIVGDIINMSYDYHVLYTIERKEDDYTIDINTEICEPEVDATMKTDPCVKAKNDPDVIIATIGDDHCTVVYDPIGSNGKCGTACLAHALKTTIDKLIIPSCVKSNNWYCSDELGSIANANGVNLITHEMDAAGASTITTYTLHHARRTLCLRLHSQHWTLVNCACSTYKTSSGCYSYLRKDKNDMYINCANNNLTDGAGQAKIFRQMFPGYDIGLEKPINIVHFVDNKDGILCLAVANNQKSNNDRNATLKAYNDIFAAIALRAKTMSTIATIYMPMIGTSLFGADICCFKTTLARYDFGGRLCLHFHNQKEAEIYNNTWICKHGGYKDLIEKSTILPMKTKYDCSNYDRVLPAYRKNKMQDKAKDIFKKIRDTGDNNVILEISGAPGDFADYALHTSEKYEFLHYVGPDHFTLKRNSCKPLAQWNDIAALNAVINGLDITKYHLLSDSPVQISPDTHDNLLNICKNNRIGYTFKYMGYNDKDETDRDDAVKVLKTTKGLCVDVWQNDASDPTSSEIYVTITHREPSFTNVLVDVDNLVQQCDENNLQKQKDLICTCDNVFTGNSSISWIHNPTEYDIFIGQMSDDKYLIKRGVKIRDNVKSTEPLTTVKCIFGVAGSRKSRSVLVNSCAKCTLIIAPYRHVVDQHNALIANCAVTYVKAIDLLINRKGFKRIVVDEITSINPYFVQLYHELSGLPVFGLGDPNQVGNCDFGNCSPKIDIKMDGYLTLSHRVIKPLEKHIAKHISGFLTTNQKGKMEYKKDATNLPDKTTYICHTQKLKDFVTSKNLGINVMTAHESMGCTFKSIAIFCHDINDITDKPKYVYTALTRSCDYICILAPTETEAKDYVRILYDSAEYKFGLNSHSNTTITDFEDKDNNVYTYETYENDDTHTVDAHNNVLLKEGDLISKPLMTVKSTSSGNVTELNINNTSISRAIDANIIDPHSDNITLPNDRITGSPEILRYTANQISEVTTVQEILDKVFIPANDVVGSNIIGYKNNIIKEIKSGKNIRIDTNALTTSDTIINGGRISDKMYVRTQASKDNKSLIDTCIHRYMSAPSKVDYKAARKYHDGLCKFMQPAFRNKRETTSETTWLSVMHYLTNLQKKLGDQGSKYRNGKTMVSRFMRDNPSINDENYVSDSAIHESITEEVFANVAINNIADIKPLIIAIHKELQVGNFTKIDTELRHEYNRVINYIVNNSEDISCNAAKQFRELNKEWYDDSSKNIQFHMKNQPKENRSKNFDVADKVGQGISAWSKLMNCILSGFEKAFEVDFKNHLKPNIIIAADASDRDIGKEFAKRRHLYVTRRFKKLDADMTEFDSTQNKACVALHAMVLQHQGFSEKAIECMVEIRRKYHCESMLTVNGEQCRIGFDVAWVMTSGALFTLWGNTMINMCIMGACYVFKNLHFAAFKGDDSHIVADDFEIIMHGNSEMAKYLGHKIKASNPAISEFIANIITPEGFFPDLIRRTARVVSRVYTHPEDWEQIKLSIADCLNVLPSDKAFSNGCIIASVHYQERGINITPSEVNCLANFLTRCLYDDNLRPSLNKKWCINQLLLC